MSSSEESSDEDVDYVMYRNRQDWRDVIPSDPEQGSTFKVVKICYSDEFKDCFDYFRTICEKVSAIVFILVFYLEVYLYLRLKFKFSRIHSPVCDIIRRNQEKL